MVPKIIADMPNFEMALIAAIWGGLIASPSTQNHLSFPKSFRPAAEKLMADGKLKARMEEEFFLKGLRFDTETCTFNFKRQGYWHRKVTETVTRIDFDNPEKAVA